MAYKDKEKQLQYQKDWYNRNKERHTKNVRKNDAIYKQNCRDYITSYLLEHPCIDCGEADIVVLDFDHLGNKEGNVADLLHRSASLEKIKKEISKCEVRCANCHRRKTAKAGNFYRINYTPVNPHASNMLKG